MTLQEFKDCAGGDGDENNKLLGKFYFKEENKAREDMVLIGYDFLDRLYAEMQKRGHID